MEIVGNDSIIAIDNLIKNDKYHAVLRFHLHPLVSASRTGNIDEVLLRLNKGPGWLFKVNLVERKMYLKKKTKNRRI